MSRRYQQTSRVHLGDCTPSGRARIDALLRFAQNIADDDVIDSGFAGAAGWVIRRTALTIRRFPSYLEDVALETWCSGLGGRWAERTTTIIGGRGGDVEVVTLWVHLDPETFRPLPLPVDFIVVFGPSAGSRKVSARLTHSAPPTGSARKRWLLRSSDFDVLGHVNNAASAEVVESLLADRRSLRAPLRVSFEYPREVPRGESVDVVALDNDDGGVSVWLVDGNDTQMSAVVTRWNDEHLECDSEPDAGGHA